MAGYGRWCWFYACGHEPDFSNKTPGRHGSMAFCLPPVFGLLASRADIWTKANNMFGTLLDAFEEEDISSPEALTFLADAIESSFEGHDLQELTQQLGGFLREAANAGRCVTFWL